MIDNRPRVHRARKRPAAETGMPPQETKPAIHSESQGSAPMPVIPPDPPKAKPVRAKAAASPLGGLGNLLGGGGIGGVLPIVLIASALQGNRGPIPSLFGAAGRKSLPVAAVEKKAEPVPAAPRPEEKPEPKTGVKRRTQLKEDKKEQSAAEQPVPAPEPIPINRQPAVPFRKSPQPTDVKNLLSDLAGYLPGAGSTHASRIAKVIGLADEMKSLNNPGETFSLSQPADPIDRHIGLLNALGRNLPFAGASNLGKASQVLSVVNALRGGGGQGLGNIGNLGNMAGMLRTAMSQGPAAASPSMKNITPDQADGLKSTVNKLLSGMDDKQKNDLLNKAKDFLGKK